ncbi:hypothetical protein [Aerosakkonema funiforme]|uniref:Uncharacterized protein n=1 Tax=Aerosakkonema funiforme FACHB-1375 TaxID=2949571 RepID=A0A926VKV8_9CYAN|nr:hypothetical protein [Aerosakkonema funiforme]MBD2184304.1 hypothetical protein [Aerosakkonema funiforme FACHB-1375]
MSEVNNLPASNKGNWQDAIDPGFQERLMRPLVKPGVIDKTQLAGNILSRSQRFANRLPLVSQLERRFSGVNNFPASQVPITYAQPLGGEANVANTVTPKNSPASGQVSRTVVQAKLAPTPSKSTSASPSAIAPVKGMPVANSTKNFSNSVEVSSSPLPLVRSQNAEPTQVKQKPASNSPSAQSNIRTDATTKLTPQPVVLSQNAESMQVQQPLDLTAPSTAQNTSATSPDQQNSPLPVVRSQSVEPISTQQNLDLIAPSTAQNAIAISTSTEPPISPLPVVRSQSAELISAPQKQESAQSKSLPIVYAEPLTGEVSNPSKSLTLAKSQPLQTQVNPLPVVQPRYSQSQQTTRSQNSTTASLTPSSIPQATENNSQPTSETNSSIPIVQVTNTVRSWLEPQPHPLLKNQTTANPTPNQTFNQKTVRTTNLGTPLIFSTPHSATGQEQQANNPEFTSSQQNFEGGQTNYNSATAITVASQQITPNLNRPPTVESDRYEGNNLPNNNSPTKIDVDALADKVERKLMRRLVIENERRGQTRWR